MKTASIVLRVIVALLLLLLLLPLTVDLSFKNEFWLKIKYSGITFFDSEKRVKLKKAKKKKRKSHKKAAETTPKKENFFKKTYKQKGLLDTIRYFAKVLKLLFEKIGWVFKYLKFRKFYFDLSVATPDAATTAINYGKICGAVYPIISFLETNADFKSKDVSIKPNFDKTDTEFQISVSVTTRAFFLLVAIFAIFLKILKLQREESEKNERK